MASATNNSVTADAVARCGWTMVGYDESNKVPEGFYWVDSREKINDLQKTHLFTQAQCNELAGRVDFKERKIALLSKIKCGAGTRIAIHNIRTSQQKDKVGLDLRYMYPVRTTSMNVFVLAVSVPKDFNQQSLVIASSRSLREKEADEFSQVSTKDWDNQSGQYMAARDSFVLNKAGPKF